MANTKDYAMRELVYDQCFSTGKEFTGKELMEIVNKRLKERDMKPIQSRTTFMQDMTEMNEKFYHMYQKYIIVWEDRNKKRYYRYRDTVHSLYDRELTQDEVERLHEVMTLLQGLKGMPQMDWIEPMMARLDQNMMGRQKEVASFEGGTKKDARFLMQLFNAVVNRQVVDMTYQRFGLEASKRTVHPYYLKQYRRRWYLFAFDELRKDLRCFALDRILSVAENRKVKFKGTKVSFKHYFDDIVGVTKPEDGKVEHIVLWADKTLMPYLKTLPIHPSQHVEAKDGWGCIVTLDVIPNYELEQELLFFGEGISVLEPASFRERMTERLRKSLNVYDNVKLGE